MYKHLINSQLNFQYELIYNLYFYLLKGNNQFLYEYFI